MLSKTAWFKILIVKIQNLRVSLRFKAQVRFKASKGTNGGGDDVEKTIFTILLSIIYIVISL